MLCQYSTDSSEYLTASPSTQHSTVSTGDSPSRLVTLKRRHEPYKACVGFQKSDPTVMHRDLLGRCRYIDLSSYASGIVAAAPSQEPPTTATCITISQTRFETTPTQLRWLAHAVAGVTLHSVQFNPNIRAFRCWVRDRDAARALSRALHRRALFDLNGVFVCANDAELQRMREYLTTFEFRVRSQCLPRQLVRVDGCV